MGSPGYEGSAEIGADPRLPGPMGRRQGRPGRRTLRALRPPGPHAACGKLVESHQRRGFPLGSEALDRAPGPAPIPQSDDVPGPSQQEPPLRSEPRHGVAIGEIELDRDSAHVRTQGRLRDPEVARRRRVVHAGAEHVKDVDLPLRGVPVRGPGAQRVRPRLQRQPRPMILEGVVAGGDLANDLEELRRRIGAEHVAANPRANRRLHLAPIVGRAQHHDAHVRMPFADPASGRASPAVGKVGVEEQDVRLRGRVPRQDERLVVVGRLADHDDIARALHGEDDATPHDRAVVGDPDVDDSCLERPRIGDRPHG